MFNAVLGAPFYTSLFNPNNGEFLYGGTISFFGEDKVTPKPVYPSPETVGAPYPQPFTLNSIAVLPPMYFLTDEPYWVVVAPAPEPGCACESVDPIYSFYYYPSGSGGSSGGSETFNYLSNGQFAHPIPFNKPEDVQGKIQEITTEVAAAWWLDVDSPDTNSVLATFDNVIVDQYPSDPINFFNVQVTQLGASMQFLDLYQYIGAMNFLQDSFVTLSILGQTTNGVLGASLQILVETSDQNGALVQTPVGNLAITNTLNTYSLSFQLPAVTEGSPNNFSYTRIIIRYPLLTITSVGMTNMQLERGSIIEPQYVIEPTDQVNAKSFANDFNFPCDDNTKIGQSEAAQLTYVGSTYQWTTRTGEISLFDANAVPYDVYPITQSTREQLDIDGYHNGIPFSRLFGRIGNNFGEPGLFTSTEGDTVTATSTGPGVPFASGSWDAQTSGFTITPIRAAYALGVTATRQSDNVVRMTFNSNYAPNPINPYSGVPNGAIGNWYFTSTGDRGSRAISTNIINPGSSSTACIVDFQFLLNQIQLYRTAPSSTLSQANYFEYSSSSNTNRSILGYPLANPPSPYGILISVDGNISVLRPPPYATEFSVVVPFLTSQSLDQNIRVFVNTVNTPFSYSVKVNGLPTGGSGFTYTTVNGYFAPWFKVGGVGSQPTFTGTPIYQEVDLTGSETNEEIAETLAEIMKSANFAIPSKADLPTIPTATPVVLVNGIYL